MSHNHERVRNLLRLSPLAEKSIGYDEFLAELAEHPERGDSAAAVLFRAITAMGVEDPAEETNPKRRQYLKLLKDLNIPSLRAFKHVAGSQRFALQPMTFLLSASAGGAQRQQMMIIDGGPGSGKDYFKDGMVRALEFFTDEVEKIFAVEGCPDHENPVNLLKLLKKAQLKELAEELKMGEALIKMVAMACEPCQHCYTQVMGTTHEPKEEPNFDLIKVVPVRLSVRSTGISDWQPGGNVSLAKALRKAGRGFISLPDCFIERKPREGETDERLLLLDATQYRRLPGEVDEKGLVTAASPLDTVILATTNKKALRAFLYGEKDTDGDTLIAPVVPDADAFTSRAHQMRLPYNTVRCEEVRVYQDELNRFKVRTNLDPLVLEVLATVAVLSRLAKPRKKGKFVHPLDIVHLYEGEPFEAKLRPESEYDQVWDPKATVSSYSGNSWDRPSWSGYGSGSSSSSKEKDTSKEEELPPLPDGVPISAGLLWQFGDPNEGQNGLDMRTMLSLISRINQAGLKKAGQDKSGKETCINSLELIGLLRGFIGGKSKASNNTPEQQAVYDRVLKWLGGIPVPGAAPTEKPDIVEAEYRRLLRALLMQVFAPDYDARAQKLFSDYRLHAPAVFEGKPTVKDPQMGQVPANTSLVDELDCHRLDKSKGAYLSEDDRSFRGKLDAIIGTLRDEFVEEHGAEAAKEFKVTWETIPELAKAIRGKLDAEIGLLMEKLITTEVKSDLTALQQEQLTRAESALKELGFCSACLKPVLEYAKRTKVWSFKLN
jgi:predicted Ser/Thr protein kinase